MEWDRMVERATDCDLVFLNKGDVVTQVMFHPRAESRERNLAHNSLVAYFLEAGDHDARGGHPLSESVHSFEA